MLAGTTTSRDLTNKEFATLALLQAHVTAAGNYYDWGSEFTVYADGTSSNNGNYKLVYNLSSTSKIDTSNLKKTGGLGEPETLTYSNGLIKSGTTVKQGDGLSENTTITGGNFFWRVKSKSNLILEHDPNTGQNLKFEVGTNGMVATDSRSTTLGMVYAADYSAGFGTRSLPDVGWVKNNAWLTGENFALDAVVQVDTATYSLRLGTDNVHSFVNQNMTQMKSSSSGSTAIRYLIEMNRNSGVGIKIADNLDSIGLRFEADYSANIDDLTVPNWGHVRTHLGGQSLDTTVTAPTATEDGYALTWNDTNQEYELTAAGGSYTASNGLTLTGSNFTLGGTLTANTSINIGSNFLAIRQDGSTPLLSFINTGLFSEVPILSEYSNLVVSGGDGYDTDLPGFSLELQGGDATLGNANGGDVIITPGALVGTGRQGLFIINNLPTSDPGVTGAIWSNSGVLTVS